MYTWKTYPVAFVIHDVVEVVVVDVDVVQAVVRVVEPSGHLETFLQFSDSFCREISSSPIVKEY